MVAYIPFLLRFVSWVIFSEESGTFDGDAVSDFGIGCLHIDDLSLPSMISHDQGAIFPDLG